ncbi:CCT domain [Dillenia turbinata]|uniref:CCT domain n=1 Tax=Dillenia turbinata TaxID=194707 RepID=A0AAN8VTT9_9MAGN
MSRGNNICGQLTWDFIGCEEFLIGEYEGEEWEKKALDSTSILTEKGLHFSEFIKRENLEFGEEEEDNNDGDDDEKNKLSLKLNLNYQEVINAWSDRGSFWADEYSLAINNDYMGEVTMAMPLRKEVERSRKAASIRYQVRKLNADKRPRLKGRFVKRIPVKTQR